jgi:hypothetical protein
MSDATTNGQDRKIGTPDDPEQHDGWHGMPYITQRISFEKERLLGEQYRMKEATSKERLQYVWHQKVELWIGEFIGRLVRNKITKRDYWDMRLAWWSDRRAEQYLPYTVTVFDEQLPLTSFTVDRSFVRDCTCVDPHGPGYSWWHFDDPTPVALVEINAKLDEHGVYIGPLYPGLFDEARFMVVEVAPVLYDTHRDHGPICK